MDQHVKIEGGPSHGDIVPIKYGALWIVQADLSRGYRRWKRTDRRDAEGRRIYEWVGYDTSMFAPEL